MNVQSKGSIITSIFTLFALNGITASSELYFIPFYFSTNSDHVSLAILNKLATGAQIFRELS